MQALSSLFVLLLCLSLVRGQTTYTVCDSGCDATTIAGGFGLTTTDGDVVKVLRMGVFNNETPVLVSHRTTLSLDGGAVTVNHSGVWITVPDPQGLIIQGSALTLRGVRLVVEAGASLNVLPSLTFVDVEGSNAIAVDGAFVQKGPLTAINTSVTDGLVALSGTWVNQGFANLTVAHGVPAVKFANVGKLRQEDAITINMLPNPAIPTVFAAVDMTNGGYWGSSANSSIITINIDGSNMYGVNMGLDSAWDQDGSASIRVSNGATGVVLNSSQAWTNKGPVTFDLAANTTGLRFVNASAKWSQQQLARFNIGKSSTGVMLANGGIWQQFADSNIMTYATSALGVTCSAASTCCSQVSTPTLNKINADGSTAGRPNDCNANPSPTPLPKPTLVKTSALFGDNVIDSLTLSSNDSTSDVDFGVRLNFIDLQLGFNQTNLQRANVTRQAVPPPDGASSAVAYRIAIDAWTNLTHTYAFYEEARPLSFGGVDFTVPAGTVKWSVDLSTTAAPNDPLTMVRYAQKNGITLRYRLTGLNNSANASAPSNNGTSAALVVRQLNTPRAGMTTFAATLPGGDVVAQVEVLNSALVDGVLTLLGNVDLVWEADDGSNSTASDGGSYVLVMTLPPFISNVQYDPSMGLGVLLGSKSDSPSSTSSSDVGMIVAVSVAIPVAVALVLGVIVISVIVVARRRRLARSTAAADYLTWDASTGAKREEL